MFSRIKIVLTALLIAVSSIAIEAANTTHTVKKGETVYGISRIYGISIEKLLEHNPSARDGLKEGVVLIIPDKDADKPKTSEVKAEEAAAGMDSLMKITEKESTAVDLNLAANQEKPDSLAAAPNRQLSIGIMLPFMLKEKPDKNSMRYVEFYKGFLLAADSLSHGGKHVKIYAYDTCDNVDTVKSIMGRREFSSLSVVIVPDNDGQMAMIADAAKKNGTHIFNMYSIKDESQKNNPWVMQANIPSDEMNEKAISVFMERYDGYTPVFLSRSGANHNKREFVDRLKRTLSDSGRAYREIVFGKSLPIDSLNLLPKEEKFVFVPLSGNKSEFVKLSTSLKAFKKERDGVDDAVKLYGYPDWVTFKDKEKADLHELNATIFSRFYINTAEARAVDVFQRFKNWFNCEINSKNVPLQGVLGFDTGYFLIKALRHSGGDLSNCLFHDGVQTGFDFVRTNGKAGGLCNDALYIIEFRPGGFIERVKK